MTNLLIDDAGQFWDGASARVREAFSSPYSGDEFSDYVVRNLGFVAINQFGSSVQVRLHPLRATNLALASLVDWAEKRRLPRIALAWYSGSWRYELLTTSDLLWRIDKLVKASRAATPTSFLSEPIPAEQLPDAGGLISLLQKLPGALDGRQQDALLSLVRRVMGDRYLVVEAAPNRSKLVFGGFGNDIFVHQLPWRERAAGRPIDDLPDPCYGRWVNGIYESTLRSGKPRAERVDAIVNWGDVGRTRMRYSRILIPFRTAEGQSRILCSSATDDRIDLRAG